MTRPWVPLFAIVGWLGLLAHNAADLPGQTFLSLQSRLPLIVTMALIALWFTSLRSIVAWGLLLWGGLNLAGAVITVLPLAVLPFEPAQTLTHYAFHLVYGSAQIPVIIATAVWIHRQNQTPSPHVDSA